MRAIDLFDSIKVVAAEIEAHTGNGSGWIVYKRELNRQKTKYTKPPRSPWNGCYADVTDPNNRAPLDAAIEAVDRYGLEGVGYCPEAPSIVCIDLDDCLDENGSVITDGARRILAAIPTYTEKSPSGKGLHLLAFQTGTGETFNYNRQYGDQRVEVFNGLKYMTITGNVYDGRTTPKDCTEKVLQLVRYLEGQQRKEDATRKPVPVPSPVITCAEDTEVLRKMFAGPFGQDARDLYNGNIDRWREADTGGQHRADAALCNQLAYWTLCDPVQMDRIFRTSALMRPKWDSARSKGAATYGTLTIDRAISQTRAKLPREFSAEEKHKYAQKREAEEREAALAAMMRGANR